MRDLVDLGGARLETAREQLPQVAAHANLHTGRAGEAQWEAGNGVVPVLAGRTPWSDCESLMEFFFG